MVLGSLNILIFFLKSAGPFSRRIVYESKLLIPVHRGVVLLPGTPPRFFYVCILAAALRARPLLQVETVLAQFIRQAENGLLILGPTHG